MERRFREVIGLLGYEELLKVRNDLDNGGDALRILLDNRIKDEIKKQNEFCAVCASRIEPCSSARFTLSIGSKGMERQASFCALDCLEYFIDSAKKKHQ